MCGKHTLYQYEYLHDFRLCLLGYFYITLDACQHTQGHTHRHIHRDTSSVIGACVQVTG